MSALPGEAPQTLNLSRSAGRLVWTLAGLGLSGCVACLAFLVVAFSRVETIAAERSQIASDARDLVDLFGRYSNAVSEHLHRHLEPETEHVACDPAAGRLPEMLRQYVENVEERAGTNTLRPILADFDARFTGLELQVADWSRANAEIERRTRTRLEETFGTITSIRGTLSTLAGRIRLKRILDLREFRNSPTKDVARAVELLQRAHEALPLAGAETELSDLALYAQQLATETLSERIANLRENSVKPGIARLHQSIARITAEPGDSDELEHVTSDLIALGDIMIGSSGSIESLADLARLRDAYDVTREALSRSVEQFVADMHLSGEKVLAYVAENHAVADTRVVRSIDVARTGCGVLLAGLALATCAVARRVSRDLRDQATALQNSNTKLDLALEEANAANRAKTDFLANMSHEIRTPMTAILGFADLLAEPDTPAPERDGHVTIIRRQGEHLLSIINDILDLAKIDLGRLTVERIPTNPAAIASEALSLLGPAARAKGLALSHILDGPPPPDIITDPLRLRQILINLLGNAVKFTPAGEVRLSTVWNPADSTLRFHVRDSGVGLSPQQMSRLFRPFSQADETMSRRFGGTGIGLSLSQRLAERLNAIITVESAPGQGSTFTLSLRTEISRTPTIAFHAINAPAPTLRLIAESEHPLADLRVLFAEDGPDNQRLISHHLSKAGAEVVLADNGVAAIRLAREALADGQPFNLILMDMQMPELDGYAATAILRKENYPCPILALTAHAMSGDRERCIAAGCAEHLTKPIDRVKLLAACATFAVRAARV